MFLWLKNPTTDDFSLTAFKNFRLSFGLCCSPSHLLLALYKLLVSDARDDSPKLQNFNYSIIQLSYMDNLAVGADNIKQVTWYCNQLYGIFNSYCFQLQKFNTNCVDLQNKINKECAEQTETEVNLLGILQDKLYT